MRVKSSLSILLLASILFLIISGLTGCGGGTSDTPAADESAVHTVAYDPNGSDFGYAPIDPNSYKPGFNVVVLPNSGNLVKNGYTFSGWNTQANGNGVNYQPWGLFMMGQNNVTMYAQWTRIPTYTVIYNGNGNDGGAVPVDPTAYEQGQIVTVAGNPLGLTKSGYSFVGWNTKADGSGTTYSQWQTFPIGGANITLYAIWTTSPAYSVTYGANGASGGSVPVSTQDYLHGQTVYVPGNTGGLVNTGYTFIGWNAQTNGSGTTYSQGQFFAMGSASLNLYADWTNQLTYTVNYYGNGNNGGSVPVDTNNYIQTQTATVLGNTGNLTKTGYVFFGWNTKPDGSGITYEQGEQLVMPNYNESLYALWAVAGTPGPVQVYSAVGPTVTNLNPVRLSTLAARQGGTKMIPLGRTRFASMSTMSASRQDSVLQSAAGPLVAAAPGLNFDGVSDAIQNTANGDTGYVIPPDTNGAVGATQYVQWVNVAFQVFSKTTGQPLTPAIAGNVLWRGTNTPCASNNDGDIIAQYDKTANRWVMMQPVFWGANNDVPPSGQSYYMCVAVSTTSDATGSYYQYAFPLSSAAFPDYPKLGVWQDGYYLSVNQFNANGAFMGPEACVMDRASMLAGKSAKMQCFSGLGPNYASMLPSDADGTTPPPAGAPDYFISLDYLNSSSLDLWEFHADFSNPANSSLTGPLQIPVAPYTGACQGGGMCIPQPGTTNTLDSLGDRLMYRFAYRNMGNGEAFVASHSVDTGNGYTGERWYQLTTPGPSPSSCISGLSCGVPSLYQQGTFAPDSNYRWLGSIAMDKIGDIAMGYSESSSTMYPSIYFTGQQPGDPLNTMESEALIYNGSGSETNAYQRWGDYSSISVDPQDDCTFWYTNEYFPSTGDWNWQTRIASFKFPNCQ